jgi:SAM-dependent methyltransferase
MLEFHADRQRYFDYQYWTTRDYIIPFLAAFLPKGRPLQVLEVGCGEAGVLKAFVEQGHRCFGIELDEGRLNLARQFQEDAVAAGRLILINRNIYDIDIERDLGTRFDLILLKDVIEHIPQQERITPRLGEFLAPGGQIFFGFPPWQMPFGGHQQICDSKLLRAMPWIHLLPAGMYRWLLRLFGEKPTIIQELLELQETGISIERFERIVRRSGLQVLRRRLYLLNPIYRFKFGRGPVEQLPLLGDVPMLRNFFTTAAYYLVASPGGRHEFPLSGKN